MEEFDRPMGKPRLTQQLVYLHCRSLFVGDFIRMRRLEAIQNFIGQRKGAIPFLIEGYPFEKVCSLAQKLLIDGAFASEAIARHKFPTLFDPTQLTESVKALPSMQGAQLEARGSWAMVARAEKRVEPMESRDTLTEDTITSDPPAEHIRSGSKDAARVPPPAPVYLPYATQHKILNKVQGYLEECCYAFTTKWLPDLIVSQGLEVPEQYELTQWILVLKQSSHQLPSDFVGTIPELSWKAMADAAQKLQNTIVRRVRMTVEEIIDLMNIAIYMTQTFDDPQRTVWCEDIRENLQTSLEIIKGVEKGLRETLSRHLQDITKQKAALDSLEADTIAKMMEYEKKNRASICEAVDKVLFQPNDSTNKNKGLPISDAIKSAVVKEEATNPDETIEKEETSSTSGSDTSLNDDILSFHEFQASPKKPAKPVDQASSTTNIKREHKRYSHFTTTTTTFESLDPYSPEETLQMSNPRRSFSNQLAAEMIPDLDFSTAPLSSPSPEIPK